MRASGGRKGREDAFDIVRRVIIVSAGNRSSACDVAEHFAPAAFVVQILLKVVVMIVGIEEIKFSFFVYAVFVEILFAVDDASRTSGDGFSVVVQGAGEVRIAVRTRRADVHFVIVERAAATADIGEDRLVGVA